MGAITVGLWAGIFMMAFYNGVIEQRINTAITREISHMQIHHPEFIRDYDIAYTLPEGHRMLDSIQKIPEIKAVSGRIILRGMIASAMFKVNSFN